MTLLQAGSVQAGTDLLADLAIRTQDDLLKSQCQYNLGEVLEQLGQVRDAYQIWYRLAHRPIELRNRADYQARLKVMRLFDAHGLLLQPPDFPPKVQIEVTNRCNLRCIMCTRNQMQRPTADLSLEHLRLVADQCATGPGCAVLLFFLGEPLLHPQLDEMIAYLDTVKDRTPIRMGFGIQTNAMLLSKDRARRLLEAGLRHICCSVDGLEGDLDQIRPGAEYAVVERNILNLLELRQQLQLSDLRIEISKLCDDRNSDEVQRFLARWRDRVDHVFTPGISKVAGNSYLDGAGNIQAVEAGRPNRDRRYCGQGQRLLVLADGRYAFCCSDINGLFDLGHVTERSVSEVWHSDEVARIRAQVLRADYAGLEPCASCPHSWQAD